METNDPDFLLQEPVTPFYPAIVFGTVNTYSDSYNAIPYSVGTKSVVG